MKHIFLIDDPQGVYGRRSTPEKNVALQLVGDIESNYGDDCGVGVQYGIAQTFRELIESIEAGEPDPDLVQRAKWILEGTADRRVS